MGCSASRPVNLVQISIGNFAHNRLEICNECGRNVNGICTSVAAKHGEAKAVIETGVIRREVSCPLGRWESILQSCPACGRRDVIVDSHAGVCKRCIQKHRIEGGRGKSSAALSRAIAQSVDSIEKPTIRPFSGEPTRHLHYFIYPRYEEQTAYHLDQVRRSLDTFNGKRVVCVVTDRHTVEKKFETEIQELFTDVRYEQNNPIRRELVGFVNSLKLLQTRDWDHVICFAHAKGQQRHTHDNDVIRLWVDTMYETCVRNWDQVRQAFDDGYPVTGVFKSVGAFRSTRYKWHYSGSFWWARAARLFANPFWNETCRSWWGSESYVGRHWKPTQGHCLFGDGTGNGSLYKAETWKRLELELEQWRESKTIVA